jgi:hypothetical protein
VPQNKRTALSYCKSEASTAFNRAIGSAKVQILASSAMGANKPSSSKDSSQEGHTLFMPLAAPMSSTRTALICSPGRRHTSTVLDGATFTPPPKPPIVDRSKLQLGRSVVTVPSVMEAAMINETDKKVDDESEASGTAAKNVDVEVGTPNTAAVKSQVQLTDVFITCLQLSGSKASANQTSLPSSNQIIKNLYASLCRRGLIVQLSEAVTGDACDRNGSSNREHEKSALDRSCESIDRAKCVVVFLNLTDSGGVARGADLFRCECLYALRTRGESMFIPITLDEWGRTAKNTGEGPKWFTELFGSMFVTELSLSTHTGSVGRDSNNTKLTTISSSRPLKDAIIENISSIVYAKIIQRISSTRAQDQELQCAHQVNSKYGISRISESSVSSCSSYEYDTATAARASSRLRLEAPIPFVADKSIDVYFSYSRNKECHAIVTGINAYLQTCKGMKTAGNQLLKHMHTQQQMDDCLLNINREIGACKLFVFIVTPRYVQSINTPQAPVTDQLMSSRKVDTGMAPKNHTATFNACRYEYLHALRVCKEIRMMPVVIDESMVDTTAQPLGKMDVKRTYRERSSCKNEKWTGLLAPSKMPLSFVNLVGIQTKDTKNFATLCENLNAKIVQKYRNAGLGSSAASEGTVGCGIEGQSPNRLKSTLKSISVTMTSPQPHRAPQKQIIVRRDKDDDVDGATPPAESEDGHCLHLSPNVSPFTWSARNSPFVAFSPPPLKHK